jgi:hypothetical protein
VQQQPNATPQANAPIVFTLMLLSSAMIAVLAIVLPVLLAFDDFLTLVLRCAFFAVALGDVIIAFWLRSKLRRLTPAGTSTGAVQRR